MLFITDNECSCAERNTRTIHEQGVFFLYAALCSLLHLHREMEFLRVVEEELRGVAAEARRRHPVVQEAAERCTTRTMQYDNMIRGAMHTVIRSTLQVYF